MSKGQRQPLPSDMAFRHMVLGTICNGDRAFKQLRCNPFGKQLERKHCTDSRYVAMKLFQKEIIDPVKAGKEPEIPDATAEEILKQKGLRMTLEGKNRSVKGHRELPKDAVWTPEENKDGITNGK